MKRLPLLFVFTVLFGTSLVALPIPNSTITISNCYLEFLPPSGIEIFGIEETTNNSIVDTNLPKMSAAEAKRIREERLNLIQSNYNKVLYEMICGDNSGIKEIGGEIPPHVFMVSLDYIETEHPAQVVQFLNYRFFHAMINCFQWVGISATSLFLCRFVRRKIKSYEGDDEIVLVFMILFSWVSILACFAAIIFGSIAEIQNMSKIKNFPRTYISDYVSSLVTAEKKTQ